MNRASRKALVAASAWAPIPASALAKSSKESCTSSSADSFMVCQVVRPKSLVPAQRPVR